MGHHQKIKCEAKINQEQQEDDDLPIAGLDIARWHQRACSTKCRKYGSKPQIEKATGKHADLKVRIKHKDFVNHYNKIGRAWVKPVDRNRYKIRGEPRGLGH